MRRRRVRTSKVAHFAAGEITACEAGDWADRVDDRKEAAAASQMNAVAAAEAGEIACLASVDHMNAQRPPAPDRPRLEDKRPRLAVNEANEGVAA